MNKDFIIEQLKKQIEGFKTETSTEKVGKVIEMGDGVARVSGLSDLMASEMVEFPNGEIGVALNLEEDRVGVIVLGNYTGIK
ncbi:MAG TPA: F0F1 ATP synthase subunit alpha, partial [Candidatus Moranbacteria bacterium]|nr:F0F1 ATP synthase subunit alpha [Candidatus Moranbacteria bacterium]